MNFFFSVLTMTVLSTSHIVNASPVAEPILTCRLDKIKALWIQMYRYEPDKTIPYVYVNEYERTLREGEYSIVSNLFKGGQLIYNTQKNLYKNDQIEVKLKGLTRATIIYNQQTFECNKHDW